MPWRQVLSRAAALFALGVFLQGGVPGHFATFDLYSVRIMGVLQRIARALFALTRASVEQFPCTAPNTVLRAWYDAIRTVNFEIGTRKS